jgi:hypothetical protein
MNEWNCADEAYKMTDNGDGTFSLVINFTAGDHALKVTNGTWDISFGGDGADGNYEFNVPADGAYTVSFDGVGTVTVEEGANTPAPTEPEATEPAEGEGEGEGEQKSGNGGLIAGIIVAVVAVIGGAVAIFFILKKK